MTPEPRTVDFWFDPGCPFTWVTSRWLVDVADRRGLQICWRLMSLGLLNADKDVSAEYRAKVARSQAALRVLAAVSDAHGNTKLGDLYTALGSPRDGGRVRFDADTVAAALSAAGLPASLTGAMADATYDDAIRTSHEDGQRRAGMDAGSPVIAIGDAPGLFGPVVVPAPTGDAALALFDALLLLATVPEFSELKRGRASL